VESTGDNTNIGTFIFSKLKIPPRSELYHLKPIGVGTPYVESSSSYATRLAHEHFVPPFALMKRVTPSAPTIGNLPAQTDVNSKAMMSAGVIASNFIDALEKLTMRQDLSCTTMITWVNVLSQRPLIRRKRAWCPACYETWRQRGEIVYDPLIWALGVITVCPIHKILLISSCPNCKAQVYYFIQRSQLGFCTRCNVWLGQPLETLSSYRIFKSTEDARWQLWKAQSTGELLSIAPNLQTPGRDQIARSLRYCIDKCSWGRLGRFASQFKVPEGRLRSWLQHNVIPILGSILQLTYRMDMSLVSFLCGTSDMKGDFSREESDNENQISHKPTTDFSLSYTAVKNMLAVAASSEEYPSLQKFVRLTGWSRTKLQHCFPDLCVSILIRHSTRYHKSIDLIKALPLLQAALFENPPPSLQEVATRVGATPQGLKYRFPETAEEIVTRYKAYKYGTDWGFIEECLKKILSQEVALSLGGTSRSIGVSVGRLRRRFPDLTAAIASRFEEHIQLQQEAREKQLWQEVLEAVISIQGEGLYPYRIRVAERVKISRDLNEIGRTLRQVRLEVKTYSVAKS